LREIAPHLIQTKQQDLIHPWKGTKVGEYTITTIGGIEIERRYNGKQLPKHLVNEAKKSESHSTKFSSGGRMRKGKIKHQNRKNKNKGKRRVGKHQPESGQ